MEKLNSASTWIAVFVLAMLIAGCGTADNSTSTFVSATATADTPIPTATQTVDPLPSEIVSPTVQSSVTKPTVTQSATATSIAGETTTASPPTSTATAVEDTPVSTVEANGWRFAIMAPRPNSSVSVPTSVCYDVAGNVREAILEIHAIWHQGGHTVGEEQISINVGRGKALLLQSPETGSTVDLSLGLIINGVDANELQIEVRGLRIDAGLPQINCSFS